jgi:hypothetical protein
MLRRMVVTMSRNRICMLPNETLSIHSRELIFFFLGGGGGGGGARTEILNSFVPIMFPMMFAGSQCVPQDVPNGVP